MNQDKQIIKTNMSSFKGNRDTKDISQRHSIIIHALKHYYSKVCITSALFKVGWGTLTGRSCVSVYPLGTLKNNRNSKVGFPTLWGSPI